MRREFNVKTRDESKKERTRDWADVFGIVEERMFPVDVKVSTFKAADNICGKIAFLNTFTNLPHNALAEFGNELLGKVNKYDSFFEYFNEYLSFTETGKDYYFFIVNKNDPTDCLFNSLRGVETVTLNGSNLPFQSNWSRNRTFVKRTYLESLIFSLEHWLGSEYKSPNRFKIVQLEKMIKRVEDAR